MEEIKEQDNTNLSLDENAQLQMLIEANAIEQGKVSENLDIDGKIWRIRDTSMLQNVMIQNLDYDVLEWQQQISTEGTPIKKIKKLNIKIRKVYAKKAALAILGRWRWLIPFVYSYTWRKIYNHSERVSATINSAESVGGSRAFFLANLGSSKQTLALSMAQVGEAVKQKTQRMESAESMVRKDGLPKKADNK